MKIQILNAIVITFKQHEKAKMSEIMLPIIAICSFIIALSVPLTASAAPFAYVANTNDSTVSVIDTAMQPNTVVNTIDVGINPVDVDISPDGKRVYVANRSNSISVIDTTKIPNIVASTIDVGSAQSGTAVSPDGKRLYVIMSNIIKIIDTTRTPNIVVETLTAASYRGNLKDVTVTPDGKRVYVASSIFIPPYYGLSIFGIDTTTTPNTFVGGGGVGFCFYRSICYSWGIAVAPDGKHIYATFFDVNSPISQSVSRISVIETALTPGTTPPNAIVANISLPNDSDPVALAFSPNGKRLYSVNQSSNNVSVIDTTTTPMTLVDTIAVGIRPVSADVTQDGKYVYVVNAGSNSVSVIDTTKTPNTVVDVIPVGNSPSRIAIRHQQLPLDKDQCKNAGWQTFGFSNQGQCIKFVNARMTRSPM
jgi:YVTN family beta-propeller protein